MPMKHAMNVRSIVSRVHHLQHVLHVLLRTTNIMEGVCCVLMVVLVVSRIVCVIHVPNITHYSTTCASIHIHTQQTPSLLLLIM